MRRIVRMEIEEDEAHLIASVLSGEVDRMEWMVQRPLLDKRIAAVRHITLRFVDAWRIGQVVDPIA